MVISYGSVKGYILLGINPYARLIILRAQPAAGLGVPVRECLGTGYGACIYSNP